MDNVIIKPEHPLLIQSKGFADLCKVLEPFNIYHVTYSKQFKNGSRINLSNKPEWVYDYYNLRLYRSSIFEEGSASYHSDFTAWLGEYDLDVYQHGLLKYNMKHNITITEPVPDGCEFYIFATAPQHVGAIRYLANHREILYHFILYLKDRGRKLFESAEQNPIIITENRKIQNVENHAFSTYQYTEKMCKIKKTFFDNTPIRQFTFEDNRKSSGYLTQRELQCLALLLDYNTVTLVAERMNISRRTAESYLENIKMKLDCDSNMHLVQKFKDNPFFCSLIFKS